MVNGNKTVVNGLKLFTAVLWLFTVQYLQYAIVALNPMPFTIYDSRVLLFALCSMLSAIHFSSDVQ
jgi:hypothetical protein